MRRVSDAFLARLDRLAELETEKRTLPPDDPRLVEMAVEIERLTAAVLGLATEQTELAESARTMVMSGDPAAPTRPIEEAPPRSPQEILDDWRAAERQLLSAAPGSPEAARAATRVQGLRAEYHRIFEEARRDESEA